MKFIDQSTKVLVEKCLLEEFYPYPGAELEYCNIDSSKVVWKIRGIKESFETPLVSIRDVCLEVYGRVGLLETILETIL